MLDEVTRHVHLIGLFGLPLRFIGKVLFQDIAALAEKHIQPSVAPRKDVSSIEDLVEGSQKSITVGLGLDVVLILQ